jgi:hypothetical protein
MDLQMKLNYEAMKKQYSQLKSTACQQGSEQILDKLKSDLKQQVSRRRLSSVGTVAGIFDLLERMNLMSLVEIGSLITWQKQLDNAFKDKVIKYNEILSSNIDVYKRFYIQGEWEFPKTRTDKLHITLHTRFWTRLNNTLKKQPV